MSTSESLQTLIRYQLLSNSPVARGGLGEIWKAHDNLHGVDVAIKTVIEQTAWRWADKARSTFQKEAAAGARLGRISPHILEVLDFGIAQNALYYVMPWIEPDTGYNTIDIAERSGRITLAQAKFAIRHVAEALRVAHNNGVVHSDVAPANIIFDPNSQVFKLADFGLLKIVEESLLSFGSASLLRGGRGDYLPPEAVLNIRNISKASDVYALGITFRVLLEGTAWLPSQSGKQVATPPVIRIRHEQRDAPDQVRQLLRRFIDNHSELDDIDEFQQLLGKIPS